jgi:hypothetical protein
MGTSQLTVLFRLKTITPPTIANPRPRQDCKNFGQIHVRHAANESRKGYEEHLIRMNYTELFISVTESCLATGVKYSKGNAFLGKSRTIPLKPHQVFDHVQIVILVISTLHTLQDPVRVPFILEPAVAGRVAMGPEGDCPAPGLIRM